mmetsp:Transcript_42053/g.121970  ORF Transcript_42053/g.121970 Transcript_42053/m.121970 type:complete len:397 (-) Transcript_42053:298-1488(-)
MNFAIVVLLSLPAVGFSVRRKLDAEASDTLPVQTLKLAGVLHALRWASPRGGPDEENLRSTALSASQTLEAFRTPAEEPSPQQLLPSTAPLRLEDLPSDGDMLGAGFWAVGETRYSQIYGSVKAPSGKGIAVKRLRPSDEAQAKTVAREVALSALLRNTPGIVKFHTMTPPEDVAVGRDAFIVMDLAPGDLRDIILSKSLLELPLEPRVRLFADVMRAVLAMHQKGIIHRDLKPTNILVFGDCESERGCTTKLCDLGFACSRPDGPFPCNGAFGSPGYVGPEFWRWGEKSDSPARDMWALGMILFQLVHGRFPQPLDSIEHTYKNMRAALSYGFNIERDQGWQDLLIVDRELADLERRLLDSNPRTRITAPDALRALQDYAKARGIPLASPPKISP